MSTVRSLRLHRQLTLAELALRAGVPARTIAEIEHGLRLLDADVAARLADALGLAPHRLVATRRPVALALPRATLPDRLQALTLISLTGAALLAPVRVDQSRPAIAPISLAPLPVATPAAPPAEAAALPTPLLVPTDGTTSPAASLNNELGFLAQRLGMAPAALKLAPDLAPAEPAPPLFVLTDDGPYGCPLQASGAILITQGYGVGTHAPANIWGALDLVVDADADGRPERDTTFGAPVVATHDGIVQVYPNSWPGGNVVMVVNAAAGWTTLYAHLDGFTVENGQEISAGNQIGWVGNSGYSTGPHLHYEVRSRTGNIDPAPLIGCP